MIIYGKRGKSGKTQEVLSARVMEDTEAWRRLTLLKKPPLPWALHRMDTRYIDLSWHVQVLQMISGSYFNGDCYSITIHGIVHELGYLKSISSWLDAVYRLVFSPATGVTVLTGTGSAEVRWLPSLPSRSKLAMFWSGWRHCSLSEPSWSLHGFQICFPRRRTLHDIDSQNSSAHTQLYTVQLKPLAKCMQLWTFTT